MKYYWRTKANADMPRVSVLSDYDGSLVASFYFADEEGREAAESMAQSLCERMNKTS